MLQTRVDSGLDGVIVADTVMSEGCEAGRPDRPRAGDRGPRQDPRLGGRRRTALGRLRRRRGGEAAVRAGLAAARVRAFADVPKLLTAAAGLNPVEGLRVGLGMLPDLDPTPHHYLVCGALPAFLAALLRAADSRSALAPIRRSRRRPPAHDPGSRADEAFEKGLDTYLATVTDHGFNASTFTARVVASTRAG